MTDKTPENGEHHPGDPVEENTPQTDVVGAAMEGLAEAEALSGTESAESAAAPEPETSETVDFETPELAAALAAASADDATPAAAWTVDPPAEPVLSEAVVESAAAPAATGEPEVLAVAEDVVPVNDPAPVAEIATAAYAAPLGETIVPQEPALVAPVAPAPQVQPIFVQAPEPPRIRGNRGAIAAIGLLAAIVLGVVFLGVVALADVLNGTSGAAIVDSLIAVVTGVSFWGTLIFFYLAFCLLGAFVNRGRWGFWVSFSWLPGLAALVGGAVASVIIAPFWTIPASAGIASIKEAVVAPTAVLVFGVAVFLTVWFGAWAAARGRRVTELNAEAQREYQETLDAGPQLLH